MGYQSRAWEWGAVSELLQRVEYIELAGEVRRAQSTFITGIISLPVRFKFR